MRSCRVIWREWAGFTMSKISFCKINKIKKKNAFLSKETSCKKTQKYKKTRKYKKSVVKQIVKRYYWVTLLGQLI